MALRLYSESIGWDHARQDLRYTRSMVLAYPEHHKLGRSLGGLLDQWALINADRTRADDAIVDANVLCQVGSSQLNDGITSLASRLRFELGGAGADSHPTFRAFFGDSPSSIGKLALGAKIKRCQKFHVVAKEVAITPEVTAILDQITTQQATGQAALDQRSAAQEAAARVSLRVDAWKAAANTARRTVQTALDAYANANKAPRSYSSAFFPSAPPAKKKTGEPAASEPQPQPEPKTVTQPAAPPAPAAAPPETQPAAAIPAAAPAAATLAKPAAAAPAPTPAARAPSSRKSRRKRSAH